MPVMIANETHRTAADGVRLSVEHMDPRSMFDHHNFMKIMMMFWKRRLRKPRFNSHWRFTCRKKIHAMQYRHDDILPDQMNMAE
ncbi:hypothetical protein HMPREF3212_00458 [Citrobacter freundii]|nr:hypothetical protein HMPREF3212_00458 [Citrobacter freundii]